MPAATEFAPPGSGIKSLSPSARPADPAAVTFAPEPAVPDPLPDLDPALNPIVARAYNATTKGAAAMLYSKEAPALSKLGYVPASERWEEARSYPRATDDPVTAGTLWVTYLAKSMTLLPHVCSFCGSELPR